MTTCLESMGRARWRSVCSIIALFLGACSGRDTSTSPEPATEPLRLVIELQPPPIARNGVSFAVPPLIALQTRAGAPASVGGRAVSVDIATGDGTLSGPRTRTTDAFGRVTFDSLVLTGRAGVRTLRFSAGDLGEVRSIPIRLDAGAPATLTIVGGAVQVAPIRSRVPIVPAVRVSDASGNPVRDAVVRWRPLRGDGSVVRATDTTDADGVATSGGWTLGGTLSEHRLEAAIDGARVEFIATAVGHQAEAVVVGAAHRCSLAANGRAACWGRNADGQLGDGSYADRASPTAVAGNLSFAALAAASQSTCGITRTADLYCWGLARFLGTPVVGDPARPSRVPLVAPPVALSSASGGDHLCVIVADASIWCWGTNASGEIGDGTRTATRAPVRVNTTERFTRVSVGIGRTCALTADDAAWCWGSNDFGGVGDGTTIDRLTPVAVRGDRRFRSISVGGLATCGITTTDELYCWGQLVGDGTTTIRTEPTPIATDRRFSSVSAGLEQVCAIGTDGRAVCWGDTVLSAANPAGITILVPTELDATRLWRSVSAGLDDSCGIDRTGGVWCWATLWISTGGRARPVQPVLP